MTHTNGPNLFTYATSELSQDAWICWLVAHVDCDARPDLRDAARDFVARLWNSARPGDPVSAADVRELRAGDPRRQDERIDVLFEVDVAKRRATFIIEDKTHTTHHSEQLVRYRAVVGQRNADMEILPIYFKTGYHFEHDLAAWQVGYGVFSLDDIVGFLRAHGSVTNDVFRDYARHQLAAHAERARAIAAPRRRRWRPRAPARFRAAHVPRPSS